MLLVFLSRRVLSSGVLVLPVLLVAAIYLGVAAVSGLAERPRSGLALTDTADSAEIIVQQGGRRSPACKTRTAKRSRATTAVQRLAIVSYRLSALRFP